MKMTVDLKNCYGIKALYHEFDFNTGNAFLIYAPNGSMKTSLARVFNDINTNALNNGTLTRYMVYLSHESFKYRSV